MSTLDLKKTGEYGLFILFGPDITTGAYTGASGASFLPISFGSQTVPYAETLSQIDAWINSKSFNYLGWNSSLGKNVPVTTNVHFTSVPDFTTFQVTGKSEVDLSTTKLVSYGDTIVAGQAFDFTFLPGVTEQSTLSYTTGSSYSTTVTNGITTTSGSTDQFKVGLTVKGTVGWPLIGSAETAVSTEYQRQWNNSTSVNVTNATQNTVTSSTTSSITFDASKAVATQGKYIYTNSMGETFELVPNQQYEALITMTTAKIMADVNSDLTITGGPQLYMSDSLGNTINSFYTNNWSATKLLATTYAYNTRDIPKVTFGSDNGVPAAFYNASVQYESDIGVAGRLILKPLVTNSTSNHALTLSATTSGLPAVDLAQAADSLNALGTGVAFHDTDTIIGHHRAIIGGSMDYVTLGDANYSLSGFSNSTIEAGDGNNNVSFAHGNDGNYFNLGNGNNTIRLDATGNTLVLGSGANFISVSGGEFNGIVGGDGATTLEINASDAFVQVQRWDITKDHLLFGRGIDLDTVLVNYDPITHSYDVFVGSHLVANLDGLSNTPASGAQIPNTFLAPLPLLDGTNEGFISALYGDALNRAVDNDGLAYWTQALASGANRAQVAAGVFNSAEFVALNTTNTAFVTSLYWDLFGRAPDTLGETYWESQLGNGVSHDTIVNAFLNSTELLALVGQ